MTFQVRCLRVSWAIFGLSIAICSAQFTFLQLVLHKNWKTAKNMYKTFSGLAARKRQMLLYWTVLFSSAMPANKTRPTDKTFMKGLLTIHDQELFKSHNKRKLR